MFMDTPIVARYRLLAEGCLCKSELCEDSIAKEKWLKLAEAWQGLANLNKPRDLSVE